MRSCEVVWISRCAVAVLFFNYTYDGPSDRLVTVSYPNQQSSTYSYFDSANDRRLETIHHLYPAGSTLSRFDYTYDKLGNILTTRQQADGNAVVWSYGFDAANQLTWAVKKTTEPVPTVLNVYRYGYDAAGNRTSEQIDDQVTGATYDVLNRLVGHQPSGAMAIEGTVSEPGAVIVQGKAALVTASNDFHATVPIGLGTNALSITAIDPSGNSATRQYEVDSIGTARTFTHDANGNLIADSDQAFEWDARNQLVAITIGTHRTEFAYDGQQRRVRALEKENGVIQSDTKLIWCDTTICEERASDGVTVSRRIFTRGEQVGGASRFFATDSLSSVTDVVDNSGVLLARFSFDPWGRRTITSGTDLAEGRYTGHWPHGNSGLWLSWFRAYDSNLGRWLSEDPAGLKDGPNRYSYVRGNPIKLIDPDGRAAVAPLAAVLAIAGWVWCQTRAVNQAEKNFGPWDKKKHCFSSCYFNRCVGFAPLVTLFGGFLHELGGWKNDSVDDLKANWYGVKMSYKFWVSCKTSCETCPVK